jgi:hypothetical protein
MPVTGNGPDPRAAVAVTRAVYTAAGFPQLRHLQAQDDQESQPLESAVERFLIDHPAVPEAGTCGHDRGRRTVHAA